MTEPGDMERVVESIGPRVMEYMKSEDYSGEHREWPASINIPKGHKLIREIATAALAESGADRMREALESIANSKWSARMCRGIARTALGQQP